MTDRRSYSGYVSYLDGNVVSWNSSRQRYVAGSSAESTYVVVAEACKDRLHLIHKGTRVGAHVCIRKAPVLGVLGCVC